MSLPPPLNTLLSEFMAAFHKKFGTEITLQSRKILSGARKNITSPSHCSNGLTHTEEKRALCVVVVGTYKERERQRDDYGKNEGKEK